MTGRWTSNIARRYVNDAVAVCLIRGRLRTSPPTFDRTCRAEQVI
jgi:hypothetical protein